MKTSFFAKSMVAGFAFAAFHANALALPLETSSPLPWF